MNKAISATIITLNEEDTIQTCIQNVAQICDEVVVLDSYSKDKTASIAKKLGARVYFQYSCIIKIFLPCLAFL